MEDTQQQLQQHPRKEPEQDEEQEADEDRGSSSSSSAMDLVAAAGESDEDDMVLDGYLPEKVEVQNIFMDLLKSKPSLQQVKDAYYNNPDVLLYSRGDCYLEDHQDSYPLHVACRESSDDIVAFLAQEFPHGLKIVDEHGYVPLHWAAERRSGGNPAITSTTTAAALSQEGTTIATVTETETDTSTTITDATTSDPLSIETFQLLIDLYPEALMCQDHENHSPLSVALLHNCHVDILKLMVQHFPKHARELKILLHDEVHLVLTLKETQEIVKLLPQMKKLELEAYNWSPEAFLLFLEHLRTNTSIEKVTSLTLPMDLLHNSMEARQALQAVCEQNKTITNLHLTICDHDYVKEDFAGADDAFLQALRDGLRHNTTLSDLKLNHIAFQNIECLNEFILSKSAPPILHLYSVEILGVPSTSCSTPTTKARSNSEYSSGKDDTHNGETASGNASCTSPNGSYASYQETINISMADGNRITSLDIENPLMSNPCLDELLHQIPKLPCLEQLRLSADSLPFHDGRSGKKFPNEWHVTESLVNIVNHAKKLKHLNIRKPYRFKLGFVCKALKYNNTLRDFWSNYKMDEKIARVYVHILKFDNATLQTLSPAFQYNAYPRLQYYLKLNRSGRAAARNPETCIKEFIPLLDQVQQNDNEEEANALETLSLRYGLLRESPGLWSGSSRVTTEGRTTMAIPIETAAAAATSNKKRRLY